MGTVLKGGEKIYIMVKSVKVEEFSGEERRAYVRRYEIFPVNFRIQLKREGGGMDVSETFRCLSRDISTNGLCIIVPPEQNAAVRLLKEKNLKIEVEVFLPSCEAPVSAVGDVVWVKIAKKKERAEFSALIGVSFSQISTADKERIREYIVSKFISEYQDYRKK